MLYYIILKIVTEYNSDEINDNLEDIGRQEAWESSDVHPTWEKAFQLLRRLCYVQVHYSNIDPQRFPTARLEKRITIVRWSKSYPSYNKVSW